MAKFYSARSKTIPPLPWLTFALTFSKADVTGGAARENGAIDQLGTKFFSEMYYSKIWSDDYRKVLDFMARHGDSWISRKEIVGSCGVLESNVNNALAALKKRKIILSDEARKGFYRLPTKSFATWISVVGSTKADSQ